MSSEPTDTKTRILEAAWRLLEQGHGREISMGSIAKACGISRQAVYLHFASRTELVIATSQYVDQQKGLDERLKRLETANSGIELLEICVEVWGNYIPEIYALAKALMRTRETDDASAAAWKNNMGCLHEVCQDIINTLDQEDTLTSAWDKKDATEILYTLLSINNWEQLTKESGYTTEQYITKMTTLTKLTLIDHL